MVSIVSYEEKTGFADAVSPHYHHLLLTVCTPRGMENTVDDNNIVVVAAEGVQHHNHCWSLHHPNHMTVPTKHITEW